MMSKNQKNQKNQSSVSTESHFSVQTRPKVAVQTLDQQRAQFIWQKMMLMQREQGTLFDAYTKLSKGAGTLIMQNGLMPTLAFYGQKTKGSFSRAGGNEHAALLNDIFAWLHQQKLIESTEFSAAMDHICTKSSAEYRHITEETLAVIRWIRHFASALNVNQKSGGA